MSRQDSERLRHIGCAGLLLLVTCAATASSPSDPSPEPVRWLAFESSDYREAALALLESDGPSQRLPRAAVREVGSPLLPKIESILWDPNSDSRRLQMAFDALLLIEDPRTNEALTRAALSHRHTSVRRDAVHELVRRDLMEEVYPLALSRLTQGGNREVEKSLYAFGPHESPQLTPILETHLTSSTPSIRRAAATVLASWQTLSAHRLLSEAIESSTRNEAPATAADLAIQFMKARCRLLRADPEVDQGAQSDPSFLYSLSGDEYRFELLRRAVEAESSLVPAARLSLARPAAGESDPKLRRWAARLLSRGHWADSIHWPAIESDTAGLLRILLRDTDELVSLEAAVSLASRGDGSGVQQILDALIQQRKPLGSAQEALRHLFLEPLPKLGDPEAFSAVRETVVQKLTTAESDLLGRHLEALHRQWVLVFEGPWPSFDLIARHADLTSVEQFIQWTEDARMPVGASVILNAVARRDAEVVGWLESSLLDRGRSESARRMLLSWLRSVAPPSAEAMMVTWLSSDDPVERELAADFSAEASESHIHKLRELLPLSQSLPESALAGDRLDLYSLFEERLDSEHDCGRVLHAARAETHLWSRLRALALVARWQCPEYEQSTYEARQQILQALAASEDTPCLHFEDRNRLVDLAASLRHSLDLATFLTTLPESGPKTAWTLPLMRWIDAKSSFGIQQALLSDDPDERLAAATLVEILTEPENRYFRLVGNEWRFLHRRIRELAEDEESPAVQAQARRTLVAIESTAALQTP